MKLAGIELPAEIAAAVRACRPHVVAAGLFSFFINLLYLAPALYMLQAYDRVVTTGGKTTLLFVTIALAIALLAMATLDALRQRLLVRASLRLDDLLAPIILRRMIAADSPAALQSVRDFDTVRQTVGSPAFAALFDIPWFPLFLIVAFLLHFWIGILALVAAALLLLLAWRNQQATSESMQIASQTMASSQQAAQAAAFKGDTVRALGMVGAIVDRQLQNRSSGLSAYADSHFAGSSFTALSRFLRLFVQSAALGLGALLAIAGLISAGAIIAASILLSRALQPVEALIGGWASLSAAHSALQRLANFLSAGTNQRTYTRLPTPRGHLKAEQLVVRGPTERPLLFDVSLEVAPGEIIGVIGPSGAGKTTLARVLAGAITPDAGTVRLGGARYSDWQADELGRHIGFVPQEPSLFEGTIKENIARFTGSAETSIDSLAVAAGMAAGAHEMILGLPQAYDTRLGPLGQGLSSGQAQRVALARALFGAPVLLVLDEPNAFLDAAGEAALLKAIDHAMERGVAVVIIAHRQSVLAKAQRLLVLEGGRPSMIGPAREVAARFAAPAKEKAG